jgi:hypothetical protein
MDVINLIYFIFRLWTVYYLNYTPILWGYEDERKLHLRVCEQKS